MTTEKELRDALAKVAELSKPGQTMTHREAMIAICDIWNVARATLDKKP